MKFLMVVVAVLVISPVYAEDSVGEKVGKTARDVKDGIYEGVENFSDMVKKVSKDVAKGADDAAEGVRKFGKDVKEGFEKGGDDSN